MAQEPHKNKSKGNNRGRVVEVPETALDGALVFDRARRVIKLTRRRLLPEDAAAFTFARVLEESGVGYVVVAGYTAILLGRGRRSDDIDFIIEEINEDVFVELCRSARNAGFTLMQGDIKVDESIRRVYRDYLVKGYSARFMYKDLILPNVEVKLAKTSIQRYALAHSIRVVVNDRFSLRISPLELQIAYKLYLGSEKDIGDAVFLYTLFEDYIDHGELEEWCARLGADCGILRGG